MKTIFTYILFFTFFLLNNLQAQTFEPFEKTRRDELVPDIHELPNGHFIYLHTFRFTENIEDVLIAEDSVLTTVKIIDADFNLVASYGIKSNSLNKLFFGMHILIKENSFLIFGNAASNNSNLRQGFIIELDQDLEPINELRILDQLGFLTKLELPLFNHQENLILWGGGQGVPNTLFEVNQQGDLIKSVELPLPVENYIQLSDNTYLVHYVISDLFQTLSADWDSLGEQHNYDDNLFSSHLGKRGNNLLLPNDQWLVSGVLYQRDPVTFDFYWVENVSIFQPDGTRFTGFENDLPNRPRWSAGFFGIAGRYEEYIYTSNVAISEEGSTGCEPFSFTDCENYVSLHSFNIDSTTNWSQYLGYDASYFPINMVATQDSGVLLLVYRFNLEDNPSGREGDTYFLKFDKDGNLTAPVGIEELNNIRIQKVLVYPNPAREILRYQYQLPNIRNLTIQLFDAAGRLVLTDGLEDRETTIDQLAAGTYFYQINGDGEKLQSGKVIVE